MRTKHRSTNSLAVNTRAFVARVLPIVHEASATASHSSTSRTTAATGAAPTIVASIENLVRTTPFSVGQTDSTATPNANKTDNVTSQFVFSMTAFHLSFRSHAKKF